MSGAPVTDQFSEYGTERGSWYDRWFYGGVPPWEHPESAARQSPLAGMRNAKTPMLILQGRERRDGPAGAVAGDVPPAAAEGRAGGAGDVPEGGPWAAGDGDVWDAVAGAVAWV